MKENEVNMSFAKNSTPALDFIQIEEQTYHLDEMAYHLKNIQASLKEIERDVARWKMHYSEFQGLQEVHNV